MWAKMKYLAYLAISVASWRTLSLNETPFVVHELGKWPPNFFGRLCHVFLRRAVFCCSRSENAARHNAICEFYRSPALVYMLAGRLVSGRHTQIGMIQVPLSFKVVAAQTKLPIPNALVQLLEAVKGKPSVIEGKSEGRTEEDGNVILIPKFVYTERNKPFRNSGWVQFYNTSVQISAEGFQTQLFKLEDYTGGRKPLFDRDIPQVTIGMKPKHIRGNGIK